MKPRAWREDAVDGTSHRNNAVIPVFQLVGEDTAPRETPPSLVRLATLLVPNTYQVGVLPCSPWPTIRRRWYEPEGTGRSDPNEVLERFTKAIERAVGDAHTIAVAYSGGADSTAVLVAAQRLATEQQRRCIAITVEQRTDRGERVSEIAAGVLSTLVPSCDHVVVEPHSAWPPRWELSPRPDRQPFFETAVARSAEEIGAEILLSGEGADSIICRPRTQRTGMGFVVRDHSSRSVAGARWMRRQSHLLSQSSRWLRWTNDATPLTSGMAEGARDVLTDIARQRVEAHVNAGRSTDEARRLDAVAMFPVFPPAGATPEAQPFLDPEFVGYVLGLDHPALPKSSTPVGSYDHEKALLRRLLPPETWRALGMTRRTTVRSFEATWRAVAPSGATLKRLGVIRPDWTPDGQDPYLLASIAAVDRWCEQAGQFAC